MGKDFPFVLEYSEALIATGDVGDIQKLSAQADPDLRIVGRRRPAGGGKTEGP
jgi:hypothetical protein